ncbi:MAG: proteasome-type protease [Hyphomicrobium sp.]|nr:proteasome-type protease [Hyphomicrobium sp.]
MTFCLAIQVDDGVIALADTRISKGSEILSKTKLAGHSIAGHSFFTMTSGLRSIRDKALIYFEEDLATRTDPPRRLYQLANAFGEQLRRVKAEDAASLAATRLAFNLHAIIGGRLADDKAATLFLIYPEGNWIEVNAASPYFAIGRTSYGLPLLARNISHQMPLNEAAAWALVAFDMTAESVSDVDYPIDVAIMKREATNIARMRYTRDELKPLTDGLYAAIRNEVRALPDVWINALLHPPPGGNSKD